MISNSYWWWGNTHAGIAVSGSEGSHLLVLALEPPDDVLNMREHLQRRGALQVLLVVAVCHEREACMVVINTARGRAIVANDGHVSNKTPTLPKLQEIAHCAARTLRLDGDTRRLQLLADVPVNE